ncbi:pentatricopeptide repeat-containing protein At3g49170, chloroplastic-like [Olea europaea var. sylvestris]|uniref:pentatricopeptide repeat-containing protein At3g49170, chloroplastic-like n=1 Tax=Olea europaea var. sylvestris TaxID=158386 RepID=UPI000C1D8873|nr:pentatricopeptide repeat-containing protein At3g49170, chloroplastic-like [Olea europaea var. sylvestris]
MISLSLPSPASSLILKSNHPSPQRITSNLPRKTLNFETLKDTLISQANVGHIKEAISILDFMSKNSFTPDLTVYSVLLKSCIRTRNFDLGRVVHSRLVESKLECDSIALNSLISLYAKCGEWERAEEIFESMEGDKRDLVSWSAMISCYVRSGLNLQAIMTFFEMVKFGEYPNEFCFSAVIQACSNKEYAWVGVVILGFVLKTGYFEADVCVGCALIDLFAKGFNDLELAKNVFDEMPEKNSVSWTLMITRCSQLGLPENAIELFRDMVLAGFTPDRFTFSSVLSACSELGWLFLGQQLQCWVIKNGLCSDVCVGCSLVDMYAKCSVNSSMDDSRKVFDRMPEHNVMSWTAIITGYVQNGSFEKEAIELYCRMMIESRVKPNQFTFASVLKACGNLFNADLGEQIYNHVVKLGLASVNLVGNSLISMYAKTDRMEDARKAFEFLFERNLISYNALIDGYARNSESNEAFELYTHIDGSRIGLDAFTFASLLSGAASVGAVGKGERIHVQLLKSGFESNQCVANALISMYTRCGNIEAAFQVFEQMEDRNVISWTSIITGFAKHGFAKRSLELFKQMLDFGAKPNEVTYIAVLSACSHAGLIDEGWRYFHLMYKEHRIHPRMEHYACKVDLLGRSGFLEKAIQFIESMPFMADTLVWRTLLSACRVHGNAELGKDAAEMILEQDPNDPAAYILLSNLYASSGQWGKVAKIRKCMKERNLVKEAGCSWMEAENKAVAEALLKDFQIDDFRTQSNYDRPHNTIKHVYRQIDSHKHSASRVNKSIIRITTKDEGREKHRDRGQKKRGKNESCSQFYSINSLTANCNVKIGLTTENTENLKKPER